MPFLTAEAWHGPRALQAVARDPAVVASFDCIVVTTDHTAFGVSVSWEKVLVQGAQVQPISAGVRRSPTRTDAIMRGEMAVAVCVLVLSLCSTATAEQPAVVMGTVVDPIGAAVIDAPVALTMVDGSPVQAAMTGAEGEFTFPDVPAGSYVVRVDVIGFNPFSTHPFTVDDGGQPLALPLIVLAVEGFTTSVVVRPTEAIAEEQIKVQEQQRWLGVVPNFYVSYVPDAAPLTSHQKFSVMPIGHIWHCRCSCER